MEENMADDSEDDDPVVHEVLINKKPNKIYCCFFSLNINLKVYQ